MNERRRVEKKRDVTSLLHATIERVRTALHEAPVRVRDSQERGVEDEWFVDEASFDHMRDQLDTAPRSRARLLASTLAVLCMTCDAPPHERAHIGLDQDAVVDFDSSGTEAIDVNFHTIDAKQQIGSIHIRDVNQPQSWDHDLAGAYETQAFQGNSLYTYHVQMYNEMYGGISDTQAATNHPLSEDFLGSSEQPMSMVYNPAEAARLDAGVYPRVETQYGIYGGPSATLGNMEIRDKETFSAEVLDHLNTVIEQNGWSSPDTLTASQWIAVVDSFNEEQEYDYELNNGSASFDPLLSREVVAMPVDDVAHRAEGAVCRDFLREQLAAYQIYEEHFNIQERGLLMLPLSRFSDAGHARSVFIIGNEDQSITVVSTDTTNTRITSLDQQDSSADATAIWYAQGYAGKEWMDSSTAHDFYNMAMTSPDLFPTTAAIAQRELMVASLQEAELALEVDKDQRGYREHLLDAFAGLSTRLSMQAEYDGALDSPYYMVPLYDILVALGTRIDDAHEHSALIDFAQYTQAQSLKAEDLGRYRNVMEQVNRIPLTSAHPQANREEISQLRSLLGL